MLTSTSQTCPIIMLIYFKQTQQTTMTIMTLGFLVSLLQQEKVKVPVIQSLCFHHFEFGQYKS